ncbi:hypothetical protein [Paracoccus marcusii]|uniref:hypothetical protein n=1 Tax=Paracoccus marcusii TaxID=59779 RepID=UPI0035A642E3
MSVKIIRSSNIVFVPFLFFGSQIFAQTPDENTSHWPVRCWILTPEEREKSGCILVINDPPPGGSALGGFGGGFIPNDGGAAAITIPDRELLRKDLQIPDLENLRLEEFGGRF